MEDEERLSIQLMEELNELRGQLARFKASEAAMKRSSCTPAERREQELRVYGAASRREHPGPGIPKGRIIDLNCRVQPDHLGF